jgi:16S rRNA (adenine(1408)-N(1))-methyltransferase
VIVDVGTGDGRAVLARARAEPGALVVGIDAAAPSMAESSRRAARRGPANAIFLAGGAETLDGTLLACRADLVTITFPWGSLLRGVLGVDEPALSGVAALVAPAGRVEVLASVIPSDGIDGIATLDASYKPRIRDAWAAAGLDLRSMRPATSAEVAASGSSWARRLDTTRAARPVWRLDLCRS